MRRALMVAACVLAGLYVVYASLRLFIVLGLWWCCEVTPW